jgi:hypothetical protein
VARWTSRRRPRRRGDRPTTFGTDFYRREHALPALGADEAEGLEGTEVRSHCLADQLHEAEVFARGHAKPSIMFAARQADCDEDAPTIALHTTGGLRPGQLAVTVTRR